MIFGWDGQQAAAYLGVANSTLGRKYVKTGRLRDHGVTKPGARRHTYIFDPEDVKRLKREDDQAQQAAEAAAAAKIAARAARVERRRHKAEPAPPAPPVPSAAGDIPTAFGVVLRIEGRIDAMQARLRHVEKVVNALYFELTGEFLRGESQ